MTQARRPSPLQRRVLIVLAALDAKRPGPVATRDIERVLEQGGDSPVYGPNLRASCRRMEAAGWLRTLRAPNLQLAVELTDAGRALAAPFLADEQARVLAEQRATAIRVLPLVPPVQADKADDRPVELDGRWHLALRGDYVIRLDGTTWLQACHDAGIALRVQINESATPEEGTLNVTAPADRTDTWYRQLEAALADRLARAGFTGDQMLELQRHRIRWPLMSQEEADRRELNSLLDDLERQQLYCRRDQLVDIVFSPVRKPGERWTERLQWLLMTDGFGFRSPLSRDAAARALAILAGYTGREVAEHLATVMVWNDVEAGERS
ncbi:hypothetical protein ACKLKO_25225 [Klebsiella variicola]|uniref:hypothetical protein n=1 Tax=Klebsiella variicola TaxID=244366 RepID=UPI003B28C30E